MRVVIKHLYEGNKRTGVTVRPDPHWPGMFRIHFVDGRASNMANLSRAKDGAARWAANNGWASQNLQWRGGDD